eukprot:CAMPEP_0196735718 /NCGR_PEP_ID=MMETSP1091-20130531/14046_1 /TAXON_ID=302021 /ORGANISM="Rhodomonas sp., Strain CCMP768" /LENGTH=152 /DNA_ID=CAMNT_0042079377 /DNA_START=431 /DNA_END=889 /DNA_ORIENTATION=-
MGNLASGLFSTSAEKEFKKLTKKNTKANRDGVLAPNGAPDAAAPGEPTIQRSSSGGGNIRFGKLVTEVTYDHEAGEIEVAQEALYAPEDSGEDEAAPASSPSEREAGAEGVAAMSPSQRKKAILRNAGSFNAGAYMRAQGQSSPLSTAEGRV